MEIEELDTTTYLLSSRANKAMIMRSLEQARNGEFVEVSLENLLKDKKATGLGAGIND